MRSKRGFTLVELMVVVLIVGILAAVALPLMSGRINSAKWSEAKAGAGSIVTALRAYGAEKGSAGVDWATINGAAMTNATVAAALGITNNDLVGTYFTTANYVITSASYSDTTGLNCVITVTSNTATKPSAPTPTGTSKILTVVNNAVDTASSLL